MHRIDVVVPTPDGPCRAAPYDPAADERHRAALTALFDAHLQGAR